MEGVAGLIAGSVSTLTMHPLDVAKVRMQIGAAHSLRGALADMMSPTLAYRGLMPNLIGNATAWGAYFYLYERTKSAASLLGFAQNPAELWGCSMIAGVMTQAATNPLWVIKTRILGTQRHDPGSYKSIWDTCRRVYFEGGIRGFWCGFVPSLFGTLQSAVYFALYDTFKPYMPHEWTDVARYFVASAIAKILAAILMYPHQVVRAQTQFRGATGLIKTVMMMYHTHGLRVFYKGLSANLARVVPAMSITLVVYEKSKNFLMKKSTSASATIF